MLKPFRFVGVLRPRLADPSIGYLSVELGLRAGEIGVDAWLAKLEPVNDDVLRRLYDSGDCLGTRLRLRVSGRLRVAAPIGLFGPHRGLDMILVTAGDTVIVEGPAGLTVRVVGEVGEAVALRAAAAQHSANAHARAQAAS